MIAFWLFLLFVILQRLTELLIAKRNEKILKAQGAIEFDKNGYKAIAVMHVAFFKASSSILILLLSKIKLITLNTNAVK